MASPRSSADEGEIVERHRAAPPPFKAKISAAAATTPLAEDGVDRFNVDRRNRNTARGRFASRSPDRAVDEPPRGLKRPRDDRESGPDGGARGGARGGHRGGRGRDGSYDDGLRDARRRDGPRRGDGGRHWDRDREYELRYDDSGGHSGGRGGGGGGGGWDRNAGGRRPRSRSRSPSFRANGTRGRNERDDRGGRYARDERDWRDRRDRRDQRDQRDQHDRRDRGRDAGRSRDWDRDADRDGRDRNDRNQGANGRSAGPDGPRDGADYGGYGMASADARGGGLAPPSPPQQPPPIQEDWVEQTPVDEEAEIQRRRQRREAILRKSRASTPLLAQALHADKPATAASTPGGEANRTQEPTPRADSDAAATASPASRSVRSHDQEDPEAMNLANDQDFMDFLGKQNADRGRPANGTTDDGPSAADYDPTVDMQEDERRDELRHGGTVAGLHGAERREALPLQAAGEDGREQPPAAATSDEPPKEAAPAAPEPTADNDEDDDDDDDDMFAEDFVEKKYEASKNEPPAAAAAAAAEAAAGDDGAAGAGALPVAAAAANGGGILEGDDMHGYYKIRRGEVLDGRYQIQSALGKGMFSGVARAWDIASPDRRPVAIKIMRNNDALRKGGYTEIAILQKLNEADPDNRKHIVRFERAFEFRGHLCMCFESLSMNLREVLKKFGNNVGINLQGVRVYAYQIFVALAHMRRCHIIHADLKPDNILVNENRSTLKICDLGTAIDRADAATAHTEITPYLVSRFYRAPEIILGMPYDYAVDMWSIGCTLYELYTGKILFTGESNNQMLRAIMEIRGKISGKLYRRGELWRMHFDDMGGFLSQEHDKFQGKTTIKTLPVIKPTRDLRTRLMAASAGMDDAEARDLNQFHDLLDRCLSLNPDKRILPSDALKHPFFTPPRPGR